MLEKLPFRQIEDKAENVLYEQLVADALRESHADFEEGRYHSSCEELMIAVAKKKAHRTIARESS